MNYKSDNLFTDYHIHSPIDHYYFMQDSATNGMLHHFTGSITINLFNTLLAKMLYPFNTIFTLSVLC
ncbi:hypothetical protein [Phocaeicola sp.]